MHLRTWVQQTLISFWTYGHQRRPSINSLVNLTMNWLKCDDSNIVHEFNGGHPFCLSPCSSFRWNKKLLNSVGGSSHYSILHSTNVVVQVLTTSISLSVSDRIWTNSCPLIYHFLRNCWFSLINTDFPLQKKKKSFDFSQKKLTNYKFSLFY